MRPPLTRATDLQTADGQLMHRTKVTVGCRPHSPTRQLILGKEEANLRNPLSDIGQCISEGASGQGILGDLLAIQLLDRLDRHPLPDDMPEVEGHVQEPEPKVEVHALQPTLHLLEDLVEFGGRGGEGGGTCVRRQHTSRIA